ncbi:hypothetical protein L2E82_11618 [Cichorium intybus]|uniref:Uncharacterized protein n=1 Tax=Cichorium intybus TaxID=13427 RepID=A0ACB9GEV5_CICIN|nr:hypothetical protein L2E82_11618 [Cichorium intybus]
MQVSGASTKPEPISGMPLLSLHTNFVRYASSPSIQILSVFSTKSEQKNEDEERNLNSGAISGSQHHDAHFSTAFIYLSPPLFSKI